MSKSRPDRALPRRSPGAHRALPVNCSNARVLMEVDEPTPDLICRVRDALCAWASTETAAG